MKLVNVWNAREAFERLSGLKKPPKLAYRLMKYERKLSAELQLCEAHRLKCVYEVSCAEPGTPVNIEPGTPEFATFLAKFNEFLNNECDLEPVGIGMDVLIESLDAERGNVLSENDLALLEPFFHEKSVPDLKLVST